MEYNPLKTTKCVCGGGWGLNIEVKGQTNDKWYMSTCIVNHPRPK